MVRVLAVLSKCPGAPVDLRQISLRAGLSKRAVTTAVASAVDQGLLLVDHGIPVWNQDGAEAEANRYRVTPEGLRRVPDLLSAASGDLALDRPEWAERGGFGLRGLMLVLAFQGGKATTAEVATLWGCSNEAARRALCRLARKPGAPVFRAGEWWGVIAIAVAPDETVARYERRAKVVDLEKVAARYRTSVADVLAHEAKYLRLQEMTEWAFRDWEASCAQ